MKYLLCRLGLHRWQWLNPFARTCERCRRLDEVHEVRSCGKGWPKDLLIYHAPRTLNKNEYWVTTRNSIYLTSSD